ncbi:Cytochrome P450 [Amycolatopsis lurida]|nr:Cytochrome P450 [Amycolatopsis lurida]
MTEIAEFEDRTFPFVRECPFSPPKEYKEFREASIAKVKVPHGGYAWAISRYEDVRTVLSDHRFSSDRSHPTYPNRAPDNPPPAAGPGFAKPLIAMDGPEHAAARRAVLSEFTVRRLGGLRPRIQEIVDERIDAMLAAPGPVDLVAGLSLPVPSLVISELLGVPYADHDFFQLRAAQMLNRALPGEQRGRANAEIVSYLHELVTEKEVSPSEEDLLGRQIRKARAEGVYSHAAMVSLAFLLLIAGHETTANMISLSTVALLREPGVLAKIKDDPGRTPSAVEELLRYFSIVDQGTARVALADVEIGGVTIRKGDGVLALGYAANSDPEAFDDPGDLDIDRGTRRQCGVRLRAAPVPRAEPRPDGTADRHRHPVPPDPGSRTRGAGRGAAV